MVYDLRLGRKHLFVTSPLSPSADNPLSYTMIYYSICFKNCHRSSQLITRNFQTLWGNPSLNWNLKRILFTKLNNMFRFLPSNYYRMCKRLTEKNFFDKKQTKNYMKYHFIPLIPYSDGVEDFSFFHFSLDLYTIGRISWTRDRPIARPLPKYRTTKRENKYAHTHTPNTHALSGIRTHDHSGWASEDSLCLTPPGYIKYTVCNIVPPLSAASFTCALSPTLVEHVVNFISFECGIYEVFYRDSMSL
jgi:hypothetical protein